MSKKSWHIFYSMLYFIKRVEPSWTDSTDDCSVSQQCHQMVLSFNVFSLTVIDWDTLFFRKKNCPGKSLLSGHPNYFLSPHTDEKMRKKQFLKFPGLIKKRQNSNFTKTKYSEDKNIFIYFILFSIP